MKVYIASKYHKHKEINNEIYKSLRSSRIAAFLPETINMDAVSAEQKKFVSDKCYDAMDLCDVFLFVYPIGNDVSCEFGYAIHKKRAGKRVTIIAYNYFDDGGTMYPPSIDKKIYSIKELIAYLKTVKNSSASS